MSDADEFSFFSKNKEGVWELYDSYYDKNRKIVFISFKIF